jgi:hypothetical protein
MFLANFLEHFARKKTHQSQLTWQLGRRLSHCGAGCVGNLTQAVGWCFYGGMGASLDKSAIFVSDVPWNKPSSELGDPPFMERLIWLTFLLKHAEFVRHNGSWISPIFMSHESDTVDGCEILQFVDGLSHWNLYMMYIYNILSYMYIWNNSGEPLAYGVCTAQGSRVLPGLMVRWNPATWNTVEDAIPVHRPQVFGSRAAMESLCFYGGFNGKNMGKSWEHHLWMEV